MGKYLQLIRLMNLCAISVALAVQGSSGFSLPLSLEPSYMALPPIEAQVVTPESGPLLSGSIVQPPVTFLPHDSPPPQAAVETPYEEPPGVVPPPPATEAEPPRDTTISPTPVIEPPQPIMTLPPPPDEFSLPPLTLPFPLDPLLPPPSPPSPSEPPREPPQTPSPLSSSFPPPLATPPLFLPSPPPIELPSVFPPPPFAMYPLAPPPPSPPLVVPPRAFSYAPPPPPIELPLVSSPPPLTISPLAPPPLEVPPHTSSYAPPPPPIELPRVSFPPPLTMFPLAPPPLVAPPRASSNAPPPPPLELPRASSPPPLTMFPLAPPPFVAPPRASSYAPPPPPMNLPRVFPPPPLTMIPLAPPPRASSYAPPAPPIDLPRVFPPSPLTTHPLAPPPLIVVSPRAPLHALPHPPIEFPRVSPPPSLAMYPPLAPPPLVVPPRVFLYAPPPPAMQESVPAVEPPASPRTEGSGRATHSRAPPPAMPDHSQEPLPSMRASPPNAPPVNRAMPESHPPISDKIEAPKDSPPFITRSNVSGSPVAEVPSASTSKNPEIPNAPSPIPRHPSGHSVALLSPKFSPNGSSTRHTKRPFAPPIHALPPPPPNQDCPYLTCPEPYTNNPPGSPCGCVWPMQVGLRLSVPLYTFFPLVSELTREIAPGVFMEQSQVRVVGAKETTQEPEKTIVLVDLVPLSKTFDDITASSASQRFWHKQIHIDKSVFGDYDVLYVEYPGLPPSPPMAPADIAVVNSMPYSVGDTNGSRMHPLGVVLPELRHKHRLHQRLVAVIVLSAIVGVMLCFLVILILIFTYKYRKNSSLGKSSGPAGQPTESWVNSSLSHEPGLGTYPGSAKTFSASEIEKVTDNFNPSRIIGEGGFGCVYGGTLEDGTSVAIKVLKRNDQQSGREFLAEVETLKRVHHRNLVKLIGICTDDHVRCLVYELVPNGSVESHLHGADKETSPLDWSSRLKIALGAARGLAYLHEDSSPGIIHRDFKSSNILLEDDVTPKVSDFGLARIVPMDEKNRQISTQITGTFGCVAPEYAMTGHLLVKSDVYSYGVVLLELLTGRKPVDMSQPPGEENLVAWARSFLTSKEGIESMVDKSLLEYSDSLAKVASIASMCVQSEVSHRPFMSEVVQALKLVSNECEIGDDDDDDDCKDETLVDVNNSCPLEAELCVEKYLMSECDLEKGVCGPRLLSMSVGSGGGRSGSSRGVRLSASGPMTSVRESGLWKSIRKMSPGSLGKNETMYRTLWPGPR